MAAYKDEKNNTWMARFYYTDWKGVRKQKKKRGFEKKKDALAYEADFMAKAEQKPHMTLKTLSDAFLADYKVRRSANSYKLAETNARLHILPDLGALSVDEITPLTIRTWQNKLKESGKAAGTISSINTTLKTMFSFAVRFYGLIHNPFDGVEPLKQPEPKKEFIEHPTWLQLYAVMTNKHDRAIFSLLYWSGMRVGEVQGLSLKDINFDTNTVNIDKQYSSDSKKITELKTRGSRRVITIPDLYMDVVKDYINSYIEPPTYPFAIKTARGLNDKLERYCKKAEIDKITVHTLRHSHASLLIKEGTAVNLISERLGHTTPSVTLSVYAHVYENQDSELAGKLNDIGNNPA
ncbi:site-specific integrase [Anaerovibrio lipolyticus]|uniref:tyrosine-type recombinase/integrase n=1 Tax=Anaerovibrio lipolyticus TaxID=82374 RepID=UPI0025FB0013|nr:site-specific integrase [Anaerovibrio lipolyticus]